MRLGLLLGGIGTRQPRQPSAVSASLDRLDFFLDLERDGRTRAVLAVGDSHRRSSARLPVLGLAVSSRDAPPGGAGSASAAA